MQEASISDRAVLSGIKLSISRNIVDIFRYHSRFRELSKSVQFRIHEKECKALSVVCFFRIILTEEFHMVCRRRPMEQKTTLSQSIDIVTQKAQYDAACKKVLAEKIILAWIMKHTMKEYETYDVWEIVESIL